ncbi:MAG: hypothetical protein ACRDVP_10775 [Acidimicrobiales bacterium]
MGSRISSAVLSDVGAGLSFHSAIQDVLDRASCHSRLGCTPDPLLVDLGEPPVDEFLARRAGRTVRVLADGSSTRPSSPLAMNLLRHLPTAI